MHRRHLLAMLGLGTVAGGGAGWLLTRPNQTAFTLAAVAQTEAAPDAAPDNAAETAPGAVTVEDMALGPEDAKVTVIEYASFTCPHCAAFHADVYPQIKANYIDTGKIRFVHREVYFDRFGLWAAMVARCGGPDRYFGIADLIYESQRDWAGGSDPGTIANSLRTLGKTAGLTEEQLEACMSDGAQAEALVAAYQQNAERDAINSTPSFIIDGEKYSNMSYADFAAILDEKLAS